MKKTPNANDAAMLWQKLRLSATQPGLWLDLARSYAACGLPWQAGYAALAPRLQALDIGPWQDAAAGDALLGRAALPEVAALAERFSARLSECPGDWLTWLYLARVREMLATPGTTNQSDRPGGGALPSPEYALQQARALEFVPGESLHWMGVWRLNAGDGQGAVAAFSGLLDIRPVRYGSNDCPSRATTRPSAACRWTKTSSHAKPRPAVVYRSSICERAMRCTGCTSRASWTSATMSSRFPACAAPWRWVSRPTRFAG